jgi:hypothetical protein
MSRFVSKASPVKALAFCILLLGTGYSIGRMIDLRQQHFDTLNELSACEARVPQILLLRKKPDRAAQQSSSQVTLAKTIEESATRSGLKTSQVVSIEPQSPRRVGNTTYEEYATVVRVEGVTLAQLAKLAAAIRTQNASSHPLELSAIRMSVPFQSGQRGNNPEEAWNLELTLTYLVYSPKNRTS